MRSQAELGNEEDERAEERMPTVLTNIGELANCSHLFPPDNVGIVRSAALAWDDAGRIVFTGPAANLPGELHSAQIVDTRGATARERGVDVPML